MLTIQKFGGSSLADVDGLRRAAALCCAERARGRDVAVVVSAMGDTTDELLALAYSLSSAPRKRELDALMSTGECASAALLAITLEEMGQRAISLTGWQSGIFTDAIHGEARILTLTAGRVRSVLAQGIVPVVCGFQGIDSAGDVTTLGRGGSDTTAVALAAALRAEHCDIYTDVAGVYTADPRLVPTARLLERADIRDMLRLSCAGAQVLYAGSLELALEKGVELRLLSSMQPGEGTAVGYLGDNERPPLAGLALRGREITLIGREAPPLLRRMLEALENNGIAVEQSALLRDGVRLSVSPEQGRRALNVLHDLCFG